MEHFREPFGKIHFVGTETGKKETKYKIGDKEYPHII